MSSRSRHKVTQRAVEALHVSVLPRTAWFDVEGFDIPLGQPTLQGAEPRTRCRCRCGCEQAPLVGLTSSLPDRDEVSRRELAGDVQGEALAAVLVEDREDAQFAPVVGAVADGSPNSTRGLPSVPWLEWCRWTNPVAGGPLPPPPGPASGRTPAGCAGLCLRPSVPACTA